MVTVVKRLGECICFLRMFFKKKIIVTEEMKQTLQSFDEISWASCCGIPYIQETSQASVEKILKHTMGRVLWRNRRTQFIRGSITATVDV